MGSKLSVLVLCLKREAQVPQELVFAWKQKPNLQKSFSSLPGKYPYSSESTLRLFVLQATSQDNTDKTFPVKLRLSTLVSQLGSPSSNKLFLPMYRVVQFSGFAALDKLGKYFCKAYRVGILIKEDIPKKRERV